MLSKIDFASRRHMTVVPFSIVIAVLSGSVAAANWVPIPTDAESTYLPESAIRVGDRRPK